MLSNSPLNIIGEFLREKFKGEIWSLVAHLRGEMLGLELVKGPPGEKLVRVYKKAKNWINYC